MPKSLKIEPHYAIAFMLLLINAVHFMTAMFFQIPGNFFAAKFSASLPSLQITFYAIAVLSAVFYSLIVRRFTLKYTLIGALSCDIIGLLFYWLSAASGGNFSFVVIGTVFMALAFLPACISVVTYLVLEFPKRLGASLMALFGFGDLGNIFANLLFKASNATQYSYGPYLLLLILLSSLALFIGFKFFDPVFPKHLEKMREGSVIWREFHYRLAFFLVAAACYGIVESVFAVWGEVYLLQFLSQDYVTTTVSLYWFMMMIGKFLLLLPLYFFSTSRVFPLLIVGVIVSMLFIEQQVGMSGFLIGFGSAGFCLAAVMPIIIASLENEIILSSTQSHRRNYLPFIEMGTALIIGAHFFGVGLMTVFVEVMHNIGTKTFFHWAIAIAALIGLIIAFLNWTFSPHKN